MRKNQPVFKPQKEKRPEKVSKIAKILLSMGLIGAIAGLFLLLTKKTSKILKRKSLSFPEKNTEEAEKCLKLIKELTEESEIDPTMSPQRIREKIIYLYNLLIAANTHLGFHRSIDTTPDEYQALLAKVAPKKQDGMIFVTRVYSHVYYGNQIPNFSQFQSYINAIRHSALDIRNFH